MAQTYNEINYVTWRTRTLLLASTYNISHSLNSTYNTDSNGMVDIYFLVYKVTCRMAYALWYKYGLHNFLLNLMSK